jgi:hypothetical protein
VVRTEVKQGFRWWHIGRQKGEEVSSRSKGRSTSIKGKGCIELSVRR